MSDGLVDLRSDTVTQPTPAMRQAMADAVVGDDVYGEDPTVNQLQELYADRVGKPAALFVPTGTMANQIALRLLATPGTGVIAGARQHMVIYEGGAAGTQQRHAVPHGRRHQRSAVTERRAAPPVVRATTTTSRRASCASRTPTFPPGVVRGRSRSCVPSTTRSGPLPIHMDGARLFNARWPRVSPRPTTPAEVTTVMSCLSKGLAAPVGSLLAGPSDVIAQARAERQRLGGGMRQAGVIAAAGIVALEHMVDRLEDDHSRAKRLAEAVAERWPAACDPSSAQTNIVNFTHPDTDTLIKQLEEQGVRAGTIAPGVARFVTHCGIDDDDIKRAVNAIRSCD